MYDMLCSNSPSPSLSVDPHPNPLSNTSNSLQLTMPSGLEVAANVFTGIVAVEHVFFLLLETFVWRSKARAVFGVKKGDIGTTAPLAAQQGVYNFFLAFGLFYGICSDNVGFKLSHLTYVIWAAVFGSTSFKPEILLKQGGPAIIAWIIQISVLQGADFPVFWTATCLGGFVFWGIVGHIWKINNDAIESGETMENNVAPAAPK